MDYTFKLVSVEKVTDGDTYWLRLDVGFRQEMLVHTRLFGWDTPELRRGSDFEKTQAKIAKDAATDWFLHEQAAGEVFVRTHRDPDSFGRWLAELNGPTSDLGEHLGDQGLATRWPTRWRDMYEV